MTQSTQTIVLSFNPSLAAQVGLGEAIILGQMTYWISKTKHFIQGKPWVYNSYTSWRKQFPFWSKSTIARLILSLEQQGFIISQNFNAKKTNRTKWYSLDFDKIPDAQRLTLQEKKGAFSSRQNETFHDVKLTSSLKTKNTLQRMKERVVGTFANSTPAQSQWVFQKKTVFDQWKLSNEQRTLTLQKMASHGIAWDEKRVDTELLRFQTYYESKKDSRKRDWDAVWHLWCLRAQTFAAEREKRTQQGAQGQRNTELDTVHKRVREMAFEQELQKNLEQELDQKARDLALRAETKPKLSSPEEVWLTVSKTLIKQVGAGTYSSWLKDIHIEPGGEKAVVLKAKSRFFADYIAANLLAKIKQAFETVLSSSVHVSVMG